MKIVNVNKFYYLRGGAERYFFSLAELLTAHGHEVVPFSMQHPLNEETPYKKYFPEYVEFGKEGALPSAAFRRIPKPSRNTLKVLGRMFWSRAVARKFDALLSDVRPDIIHIHNIYHQLSPSLLSVARRRKIPMVMTVHDYKLIWPDYLLCGYAPGANYWNVVRQKCTQGSYAKSMLIVLEKYVHHILRLYEKKVDLFLAPSVFVQKLLVEGGIPKEKVVVLPHFVEINESTKQRNNEAKKSVLYFGRLAREKGVDILLKMMHTIGSDFALRIAGTGPEEEHLQVQVNSLHLPNIVFLGHLDHARLTAEISRALFTVVPSRVPETFGYTILESFAQGKPVVASRVGAFPELVEEGKTGLLTKPGDVHDLADKVEYLLMHEKERRAMGAHARQLARREYTPERHYEQLLTHYQKLL